jgi:hypothetical protein
MKGGMTVAQLRLRAIAQKEKAKILQKNGTAPKPKKHEREQPKPKPEHQRRKKTAHFSSSVRSAVAAVAVALSAAPTASAQGLTSAQAPSDIFGDRTVLFWQLVGALVLWTAYVLVRAMNLTDRRWRWALKFNLLLLASAWVRQMLGAQLSILDSWRLVMSTGYAPAAFAGGMLVILLSVCAWARTERELFRRALKS